MEEDSMMIPIGVNYYGVANTNTNTNPNTMFSNSPSTTTTTTTTGTCSSLNLEPPGPANINADWSLDEQYKLKEGLEMYANEPCIMKYIKIAAHFPDKTVRDVALRCRWLTRKRRKHGEHNMGKKVNNNKKDKMVESLLPTPIMPSNMVTYPLMVHHMEQNEHMLFQGISGTTRNLLEQNAKDFDQIRDNLSIFKVNASSKVFPNDFHTFKFQDNVDLFYRTRNNISAILNNMREMPGIMSQMPPMPVLVNDDLANSLLPSTTQPMIYGSPTGIQLKLEPSVTQYNRVAQEGARFNTTLRYVFFEVLFQPLSRLPIVFVVEPLTIYEMFCKSTCGGSFSSSWFLSAIFHISVMWAPHK
ncbi:hypothetical protein ACFE04_003704 [Oxalis oulophora]